MFSLRLSHHLETVKHFDNINDELQNKTGLSETNRKVDDGLYDTFFSVRKTDAFFKNFFVLLSYQCIA